MGIEDYDAWLQERQSDEPEPVAGWPWARTTAERCDAYDPGVDAPSPCDLVAGHDGPHAAVFTWGP